VWGSTWATILYLGSGFWAIKRDMLSYSVYAGAVTRIVLIFVLPLIVSLLAERQRQQLARLETAHQRLRRHAATVEQLATSRERNRLARDLHDTLAHSLSALTVQLEALRSLLVHDPEAARVSVEEALQNSRRGLEDSRRAIQALRTGRVETLGLTGAIRDTVQSVQSRSGVEVELVVAGDEPELTEEEAQSLFLIAEEALTNVERHAAADKVSMRLAFGSDRIDLVIRDDGVGFDASAVDPSRYGLTGMRERAAMIGATLEVTSQPGGGTTVWCVVER
jgi:signal transduction histidine kinase